jgi:hypothetical protein
MDEESKEVLNMIGFKFNDLTELNGLVIPRDQLLSDAKYNEIKLLLPELKKKYSSSIMTSLQKNADIKQRWPLLNFVRQILNTYGYKMEPIRKADGYTLDGIKKYKRYFEIQHKQNKQDNEYKQDNNLPSENIKQIVFTDSEIHETNE